MIMFYLCRTHPTFTLLLISCKNKKPTHKTQVCSKEIKKQESPYSTNPPPHHASHTSLVLPPWLPPLLPINFSQQEKLVVRGCILSASLLVFVFVMALWICSPAYLLSFWCLECCSTSCLCFRHFGDVLLCFGVVSGRLVPASFHPGVLCLY